MASPKQQLPKCFLQSSLMQIIKNNTLQKGWSGETTYNGIFHMESGTLARILEN
jgi:hypothetical protein